MKRPTVKLILHSKVNKTGKQTVALRVTFRGQPRYFFLGLYCTSAEWDSEAGRFTKAYNGYKRENEMLATYEQRASDAIFKMERDGIPFSFAKFKQLTFPSEHQGGATRFVTWLKKIEQENKDLGKFGNSRFYKEAARAVKQFRPNTSLSDIDERWLKSFERWAHINRNLNQGGLLALMRNIRAGCNRAVSDGIMPAEWCPFPKYKLSHLKNRQAKKGAPIEFFRALEGIDPEVLTDIQRLSLDLFLFSFYMRGMNLADIAEMTGKEVQGGRFSYSRKKTGKEYIIPLAGKRMDIIRKYMAGPGLIFPVYSESNLSEEEKERQRRNLNRRINKSLLQIADLIGWEVDGLTFYSARHSFAHILKTKGVSVEIIAELLGHSDPRVTDHYLKSFGNNVLDEADKLIMN